MSFVRFSAAKIRLLAGCAGRGLMILAVMAAACGRLGAVPASGDILRAVQPDGNAVDVQLFGDREFFWHETTGGYVVAKDADGFWKYTISTPAGFAIQTTILSGNASVPGAAALAALGITPRDYPPASFQRERKAARIQELTATAIPTTTGASGRVLALNNLVILAAFSDHWDADAGTVQATAGLINTQDYSDLFNTRGYAANGALGSVRDYFDEVSYGKIEIVSLVTRWLRLPRASSYYGRDGHFTADVAAREMIQDAVAALNSGASGLTIAGGRVNDLQIHILTILHSGAEQAYVANAMTPSAIWSHQGSLATAVTNSGLSFQRYLTASALGVDRASPPELGLLCHSIAQYLGSPALHDYPAAGFAVGTWDLMGLGAWGASGNAATARRPVHIAAYGKARMGFLTPEVTASEQGRSIADAARNPVAHKVSGNASEYFLLENRAAPSDSFDRDLATYGSAGLLVWHVDESAFSTDANRLLHPLVKLEEADSDDALGLMTARIAAGDSWKAGLVPSGNFSDTTTSTSASARLYSSGNTYARDGTAPVPGILVSGISAAGNTMTYDIKTLTSRMYLTTTSYAEQRVYWHPALNATQYQLERHIGSLSDAAGWTVLGNGITDLSFQVQNTTPFAANFRVRAFSGNAYQAYSELLGFPMRIQTARIYYSTGSLELDEIGVLDASSTVGADLGKVYLSESSGNRTVSLQGSTVQVSGNGTFIIALTEVQRVAGIIRSGTRGGDGSAVVLDIETGAFKSAGGVANDAETGVLVTEFPDVISPAPIAVELNYTNGVMNITYSETLRPAGVDLTRIFLNNATGGSNHLAGATTGFSGNTLSVRLTEAQRVAALRVSGVPGGDGSPAVVDIGGPVLTDFALNFGDFATNPALGGNALVLTEFPDISSPSLYSYAIQGRNRRMVLGFSETVQFSSTDFGLKVHSSTSSSAAIYEVPGRSVSATGNLLTFELSKEDVDSIDDVMGFDNPAKTPFLTLKAGAVLDMAGNPSLAVDPTTILPSTSYQPMNRLRISAPVGGERWSRSHPVGWLINGGWESTDRLNIHLSTDVFASSRLVAAAIAPTSLSSFTLDTKAYSDGAYLIRFSTEGLQYATSAGVFDIDNTPPSVRFSFAPERPKAGPLTIRAHYSEKIRGTPSLALDQPGSADLAGVLMTGSGNGQLFSYRYEVRPRDGTKYIDGLASVYLTTEADLADPPNEALFPDNFTVTFDTTPPFLSVLIVEDRSIVASQSSLAITYNEPIKDVATPGGALNLSAYSVVVAGGAVLRPVSVRGTGSGPYVLLLDGVIPYGAFRVSYAGVEDLHSNAASEATAMSWPGPLLNIYPVVLTTGGRTRLMLHGGYRPYGPRFIEAMAATGIVKVGDDGKTLFGLREGAFSAAITESHGQTRYINTRVLPEHPIEVLGSFDALRDNLDYRLVSFPFNVPEWNGMELRKLLSTEEGTYGLDYYLTTYKDGPQAGFLAVTEQTTAVGPGYGFWMATRKKHEARLRHPGPPPLQAVAVDLGPGWNLVGNPFETPLTLSEIYVSTDENRLSFADPAQNETARHLWYIDIELPEYIALQTVPPFTGAWLYVRNPSGAELVFLKGKESRELRQDYAPLRFKVEGWPVSKLKLESGEPLPPGRPPAAFSGGDEAASTGGGGGCWLR